jgi:hypothetical protein
MINAYEMCVGNLKGKHLGDLGVDGRIILNWILEISGMRV